MSVDTYGEDSYWAEIESDQIDYREAHHDLWFSGVNSRLDDGLLVPKAQLETAIEILNDSQGFKP